MTRTSFNADWTVRPKVSPYAQLAGARQGSTEVTLPHDAVISTHRTPEADSGGRSGYFPDGTFEYQKTFDAPEDWQDRRVAVEFEGVYRDAMVFVNGAFATQRPNGYSAFTVELDPFLRYGQANTIRVDARSHDDSRWYTGAGIYRDTTLIVTDLVHVADNGVKVTTPTIEGTHSVVHVATTVENRSLRTVTAKLATTATAPGGREFRADEAPVTVRAGARATVRQRIYVDDPQLWDVDAPHLYGLRSHLQVDEHRAHVVETTFGIRTIDVDPVRGLRINGSTVKLRGACVHHDNGLLGSATIARADERRIDLLKQAGFNAIRSSHNPLSTAMLTACDRAGMLVMDETFDMWLEGKSSFDYSLSFGEWWERDVESLVDKDFNHPSVIFYSIGNEILETGDPLGSTWGRALAEKIRSLDDTRLVTNGINGFVSVLPDIVAGMHAHSGGEADAGDGGVNGLMNSAADFMNQVSASPQVSEKTAESFSVLDVAGMNYGDGRYALDHELFPNRVIVGSETFPTRIAEYWRQVLAHDHVIGDFTWTGWDYLGEAGAGRVQYADAPSSFEAPYPWLTAWTGDHDILGHRRSMSYYRETVFGLRHEPYIAVLRPENHHRTVVPGLWAWSDSLATWSWDVEDGHPLTVEVYSDADEVELWVNGRSYGTAPTGPEHDHLATWEVTYERGEITAIAFKDGAEHSRTTLTTVAGVTRLAVTPDRTQLRHDHQDLAHIDVELQDDAGGLSTQDRRTVHVTVEGAGILQALGSGRPDNDQPFTAASHDTFDGRLLAIVRPTGTGPVRVTVTADGLDPVVVDLDVAPAPLGQPAPLSTNHS
ncbi:glycoside hydrolase family 2 TIM barrel-domain containing protein [Frigoribacterium salinisoli]